MKKENNLPKEIQDGWLRVKNQLRIHWKWLKNTDYQDVYNLMIAEFLRTYNKVKSKTYEKRK